MRVASFRTLASAALLAGVLLPFAVSAQTLRTQCPSSTPLHPRPGAGKGAIKCQEIAGGDGFATMGDGTQTYLFGFGPLSGRDLIDKGLPGTQTAADFLKPMYAPNGTVLNPNAAAQSPQAKMNLGVLSAQQPAPLMAIDEDDEFFLTLSNVGMIMRPDLFEQHTVHFHGYPNASSFFDGVPDASVAINIHGSFTYYYTAPDAGTYFWHCHITPPEHLQMGMVGQLFVRPRQNRVTSGDLGKALLAANKVAAVDPQASGKSCSDILCTGQTPLPAGADPTTGATGVLGKPGLQYAYNDGDGSTRYDVEYPLQLMGFDPNFHYVGMTFNPEAFADMKDKYFMISGRSYPDTINTDKIQTLSADGQVRTSQPVRSTITIKRGQRALLRVSQLTITEFHTIATLGIPMTVIAQNARLLRDTAGNNLYYNTNSITLGGGESADLILDTTDVPAGTYFLYTTNLDHLSNDAENFGGQMTEIVVI
ncbi:multicopper oxidase domain-containing protein [Ramlibacter sp. MMS24-I3-19]|uniref:multicopper oxidase domain-containing protein n=1 Tax=Ramlibacter sp. MMS24-I3-19 TaxID=3416606 RepID=UPI003D047CCD